MKFGEKLKSLRVNKKMTQNEVASAIGVSRRAYIAYEQNNTRPRKQETYDKLAEVLECDVNYLRIEDTNAGTAGMVATVAALGTVLGVNPNPIGMVAALANFMSVKNASKAHFSKDEKTEESLTYTNDMLFQYEKYQKRFSTIAMGILYKASAEKGILCQHGKVKDIDNLGGRPDDCIVVSGHNIENWWLVFWAKDKKLDENIIVSPKDRAGVMVSRFTASNADPHRMASIVVDNLELYEAVLKFKGHNCYRGNMSVILIDTEAIAIVKEEVIATYYEGEEGQNSCLRIM